jgi:hypothetical protein
MSPTLAELRTENSQPSILMVEVPSRSGSAARPGASPTSGGCRR